MNTATPDPAAIVDLIVMLERRAARVESFQEYRRAGRLRRHAETFRAELETTEVLNPMGKTAETGLDFAEAFEMEVA